MTITVNMVDGDHLIFTNIVRWEVADGSLLIFSDNDERADTGVSLSAIRHWNITYNPGLDKKKLPCQRF